jgi:transcription initiation factor TFIID subunit 6
MRHARRTTLTTSDIEQALRILNIEPLYGHSPHAPLAFRKAPGISSSSTAPVFFVEDEEVEFDRVLREDKISLPRPTRWAAHWLAVEGVQPLIPENPPAIPREGDSAADTSKNALTQAVGAAGARLPGGIPPSGSGLGVSAPAGTQMAGQGKMQQLQQQQLVKQVLSRELQLYYTRLTSSLLPATTDVAVDTTKKTAALASLRHDAGLQALLPYLVRWVGEGVVAILKADEETLSDASGATLEMYMDVIASLLENTTLFVEPYVNLYILPKMTLLTLMLFSAAPTFATHLLDPLVLLSTGPTLKNSSYPVFADARRRTQATLRHLSFPGPSHHEDTPPCTCLPRPKSRNSRRCSARLGGNW